ncbi:MAG: pyruvate ferredoxin oxidoreductase [Clostridia bacterium]|jgi:pyruvate ferredoxin oxidoreductase alpha subunit|nr:pyruvate ferredoxin oxidoreductase [Clostridia bacterium]MDH7573816.1 pyruvate ferredoxin oxidoreductase [Clostridia bacterium]
MAKILAIVGTDAAAEAMRQIDPEVVAVYPITPQTAIVEKFAEYVAEGQVNTEMINVESEHSAMSACIGAAAAGARVMTATSSQGLALMWEVLYVAAGLRLPIVMANVNRALSAPINIHCDHSDSMGARDSGWIQLYSESAQEFYDNLLQAVRVAEHPEVRLPVMVCVDGFIISHAIDRVEVLEDGQARAFVGEYQPLPGYSLLDAGRPVSVGMFDGLYGYYYEARRAQEEAMARALEVIRQVGEEYGRISGRSYALWEEYGLEDADICLVALNSACGTLRSRLAAWRERGARIGLLKLRVFRPWPEEQLRERLAGFKTVAVFDRALTLAGNCGGPLYRDVAATLYGLPHPPQLVNYIYGLGGRDLTLTMVDAALKGLTEETKEKPVRYLGLRV